MNIDYVRYLQAKCTVDDRAINREVMQSFCNRLKSTSKCNRLRIAEIGAGTGAMLQRLLKEDGIFDNFDAVEYTLIDVKGDVLHCARQVLSDPSITVEKSVSRVPTLNESASVHHVGLFDARCNVEDLHISQKPGLTVRFCQADALAYLLDHAGSFDVVIAAAFLDLLSLDIIIPIIRNSMDPSSQLRAFYFPINYDGNTQFSPPMADAFVLRTFHESMGFGVVGGRKVSRAQSGRHISDAISVAGGRVSMEGKSLWSVTPVSGSYAADEFYFLNCILSFIEWSTAENCNEKVYSLSTQDLLKTRREQLQNAELCYEAHNVDVFGIFPT